jgi:hypothetical protein
MRQNAAYGSAGIPSRAGRNLGRRARLPLSLSSWPWALIGNLVSSHCIAQSTRTDLAGATLGQPLACDIRFFGGTEEDVTIVFDMGRDAISTNGYESLRLKVADSPPGVGLTVDRAVGRDLGAGRARRHRVRGGGERRHPRPMGSATLVSAVTAMVTRSPHKPWMIDAFLVAAEGMKGRRSVAKPSGKSRGRSSSAVRYGAGPTRIMPPSPTCPGPRAQ